MKHYDAYFARLLDVVRNQELNEALAEAVKGHAVQFDRVWDAADFSRFGDEYVRNYIGQDAGTGWEAIVMSWRKGNRTRVHGHPSVASYTGLSGLLLVELFEQVDDKRCRKVTEYTVEPGQSFYSVGDPEAFTNHIHRISCLSDNAHSLHIYSDDALRGLVYEVV